MSDVLIRNVPEDVLRGIDQLADRLGLSRVEYLRRRLAQDARRAEPVSVADLRRLADDHADQADLQVMGDAWR